MVEEQKSYRTVMIEGGGINQERATLNGVCVIKRVFPKSHSKRTEVVFDRADSLNLLKAIVYKDPQKFVFVHVSSKPSLKEFGIAAYDGETGIIRTLLTGDHGRKSFPIALFDLEQSTAYLFADSDNFRQRKAASRFSFLDTRGFIIGDHLFTFADLGSNVGFGICFNSGEGEGLICPSSLGKRIRNRLIGNTVFELARHRWICRFATYSVQGYFSPEGNDKLDVTSVIGR